MHSRIFQVSKKPIEETEYLEEERYYDYFVGGVADYVDEVEDPIEDWNWLNDFSGGTIKIDTEKKTLTIIDKEAFFEKNYENWKKALDNLSNITLKDFVSNEKFDEHSCSYNMWQLNSAYNDKHGFYIDDNDEYFGLVTLPSFMRNRENGEVFYLGNTIDYHY